jgi:hypothetical protein
MKDRISIRVVDWHSAPKFRYRDKYEYCGEAYREDVLIPMLSEYQNVHVDLTGYNRYGPSFIDEAFANLIRKEGFSGEELLKRLTFSHDILKRVELQIAEKIEAAIRDSEI